MLIPDPQTHSIAVATKVKPWENVAPQDYSYGIIPPDIEQATEFRRVLMGAGERREQFKILRRYLYADGIDCSINGTPMLGPGMTTVTPALTGSVVYWIEGLSAGTLKAFQLAGRYVLVGNGDLTDADDWTVSKDFGGASGNGAYVSGGVATVLGLPSRTITGATNVNPIVITAVAHGFTSGQTVSIVGVVGNTAANGVWEITVLTADTFSLYVMAVHARRWEPSGYAVKTISGATNVTPIVVTATAHGFTNGQSVTVSGVGGNTAANGTWTITFIDANSFSLNTSVGNGAYTAGTGVATQSVTLKDSLFVTTSNHHLWQYDGTSDTTTWTDLTANLTIDPVYQNADFLEAGDTVLFRGWSNNVWSVSADPNVAANWNARIQVGDPTAPITWLLELSGTLFIFKTDGIWTIDAVTGAGHPLATGLKITPDYTNGRNAVVWGNLAYFKYGDGFYSLGPNTGGVIELHPIGVERFIENDSPVSGSIVCSVGWNNWFLFLGQYNAKTGNSYLLKYGSWFVDDQPPLGSSAFVRSTAIFNPLSASGSFMEPVIHGAIASFSGKQITSMFVTSVAGTNQRLYVGFGDGSHAWTNLPRGGPNPTSDPNCSFATTGMLYYATHTMNFPSVAKAYRGATAFGIVLDATRTAEIQYRLANSGSYTSLGTFEVPGQRIDLAPGVSGASVDLALKLTGPGTSTPWLEGFAWHETIRPDLLKEYTLPIMARDRIARLDGAADWRSAEDIRRLLVQMANAKSTISATLPDGTTANVLIGDYTEALASTDSSFGLSWDITLKAVEFQTIIASGRISRLIGRNIGSLKGVSIGQLKGL